MSPSPIVIAGLFDGPWVFVALVLASAVVNWLTKQRSGQSDVSRQGNEPPTPPVPAPDWEERLRRMLGEAPVAPPQNRPVATTSRPIPQPQPASSRPPIIRPAPSQSTRPATALRPPPVQVAPVVIVESGSRVSGGGVEAATREYEQLDPAVMAPVRPIGSAARRHGSLLSSSLRRPQAARQAFIASLVFGTPKGMED